MAERAPESRFVGVDLSALLEQLVALAGGGRLTVRAGEERLLDAAALRGPLAEVIGASLPMLARYGLFVA